MLGRKKHKRIEIQRVSERKHRKPDPPIEKQMLTRRTFVFKGLAATSFAALTGRLWQLQFRDRAEIQAQETVYGTRRFLLPASRGMIFDRRGELIADNLKSWAVSIVPAELPDGETPEGQAQRAAIYDTLARTLGMPDVVAVVPADLNGEQGDRARREREDIYARLAATLGLPVEEIRERVEAELEAGRDPKRGFRPWVRIGKEFPPDRLAAIRATEAEWKSLGVQVINQIRYLVDVNGLYEQHIPKLIKRDIPKEVALGIEANRIYLSGVRIDDQYLGRRYHVGDELGHILGYTAAISAEEYEAAVERDERGEPLRFGPDGQVRHIYQPDDHIGKAGIEAGLEETLRGKPGRSIARVNAMGRVIDEYVEKRQEPADGHSVVLSIDLNYQRDVIAILQDQLNRTNDYIENERNAERRREGKQPFKLASGAGAAVALDVRTGEVLAMVSLPGYDPRLFVEGISQAQFDRYAEAGVPVEKRLYPLMNRCVESEQAPGSTLKIFVAAAGLQEAAITPDSKYKCLGHIGVPLNGNENNREKYWCWTRDASHQDQDVRTAIATSCDVFFYALGGPRQQDEYTKLDLRRSPGPRSTRRTASAPTFKGLRRGLIVMIREGSTPPAISAPSGACHPATADRAEIQAQETVYGTRDLSRRRARASDDLQPGAPRRADRRQPQDDLRGVDPPPRPDSPRMASTTGRAKPSGPALGDLRPRRADDGRGDPRPDRHAPPGRRPRREAVLTEPRRAGRRRAAPRASARTSTPAAGGDPPRPGEERASGSRSGRAGPARRARRPSAASGPGRGRRRGKLAEFPARQARRRSAPPRRSGRAEEPGRPGHQPDPLPGRPGADRGVGARGVGAGRGASSTSRGALIKWDIPKEVALMGGIEVSRPHLPLPLSSGLGEGGGAAAFEPSSPVSLRRRYHVGGDELGSRRVAGAARAAISAEESYACWAVERDDGAASRTWCASLLYGQAAGLTSTSCGTTRWRWLAVVVGWRGLSGLLFRC